MSSVSYVNLLVCSFCFVFLEIVCSRWSNQKPVVVLFFEDSQFLSGMTRSDLPVVLPDVLMPHCPLVMTVLPLALGHWIKTWWNRHRKPELRVDSLSVLYLRLHGCSCSEKVNSFWLLTKPKLFSLDRSTRTIYCTCLLPTCGLTCSCLWSQFSFFFELTFKSFTTFFNLLF